MKKRSPNTRASKCGCWPICLAAFVVVASPVAAQTAGSGKWEIEFHGGGILATNPTGGTAALPPAGTPFTLTRPGPLILSSRRVSSWYFGDGTELLNAVKAARGASANANVRLGSEQRITALDPVLNASVAQRQQGGSFGFRIGRHLNPRYTAEFSIDYNHGRLKLSDAGVAGVEASRASFLSAFNSLLPPAGPVMPVTSETSVHAAEGHQIFTTGVLNINLKTGGKMIPYASVGGGLLVNGGGTPSAALAGNYQLQLRPGSLLGPAGLVTHNETDTVDLRYSMEHRAFVGVLGGGVKYAVSPRWGVRLDVRALLSKNTIKNFVDANATVATLTVTPLSAFDVFGLGNPNPAIFFSNNPATGVSSSLSGPSIDGFETFTGKGLQTQISIVPGIFWRF